MQSCRSDEFGVYTSPSPLEWGSTIRLAWVQLKFEPFSYPLADFFYHHCTPPRYQLCYLYSHLPISIMTGSFEDKGTGPPRMDAKNEMMPQESNDKDRRYTHQEVADSSSNEAGLTELEEDIPVRQILCSVV